MGSPGESRCSRCSGEWPYSRVLLPLLPQNGVKTYLQQRLQDSGDGHILPRKLGIKDGAGRATVYLYLSSREKSSAIARLAWLGQVLMHSPQSIQRSSKILAFPFRTRMACGTALNADGAPFAVLRFQRNRMEIRLHHYSPASWSIVTCKVVPWPTVDSI